mgnify:CR=1 FL=1
MIFRKYAAITLWPFIVMNKNYKGKEVLLNHETIHLKQQIELLIIPFTTIEKLSKSIPTIEEFSKTIGEQKLFEYLMQNTKYTPEAKLRTAASFKNESTPALVTPSFKQQISVMSSNRSGNGLAINLPYVSVPPRNA